VARRRRLPALRVTVDPLRRCLQINARFQQVAEPENPEGDAENACTALT
jgi:hypothetical protein